MFRCGCGPNGCVAGGADDEESDVVAALLERDERFDEQRFKGARMHLFAPAGSNFREPNMWGVIHGIITFLPHLQEHGDGHIVNTASAAGLTASPGTAPYCASKYAVVAVSETLYKELAMSGSSVGVSVLCPGMVATNLVDNEHHRPPHLRAANVAERTPIDDQIEGLIRTALDAGLDPDVVAAHVHDAVVAGDRFYVFTDDTFNDAIQARFDAIRSGANPPLQNRTRSQRSHGRRLTSSTWSACPATPDQRRSHVPRAADLAPPQSFLKVIMCVGYGAHSTGIAQANGWGPVRCSSSSSI